MITAIEAKFGRKAFLYFIESSFTTSLCSMSQKITEGIRIIGKLSRYIEENTGPEDRICFLTYSGATTVLYRAKRLAASKYSYLPINLLSFTMQRKKEMVSEAVNELLQRHPAMLIIDPSWYEKFLEFLDNGQQWEDFIKNNYMEAADVEGFKMFRHTNTSDVR